MPRSDCLYVYLGAHWRSPTDARDEVITPNLVFLYENTTLNTCYDVCSRRKHYLPAVTAPPQHYKQWNCACNFRCTIQHLLQFRDGAFGVGDFESEIEQLFKTESLITSLFTSICLLILRVFLFFFLMLCWDFLSGVTSGCCAGSQW